ncbi:MAG: hypothetical protein O9272_16475, partial [Brevundimonas sp.]|nr:hypothetical protein [Brevundimonas sp.]
MSNRFKRSMAVWWLAFSAAPLTAWRALRDLLCGKFVRGWNTLHRAAASDPGYYSSWILVSEASAVADWQSRFPAAPETVKPRIGLVPLSSGAINQDDIEALLEALSSRAVPIPHGSAAQVLDTCQVLDCNWLMPFEPATRLSPHAAVVIDIALANTTSDVVYWDHDTLAGGTRENPVLKPAWDPLLQAGFDVLAGASMVRCDAIDRHRDALKGVSITDLAARIAMLSNAAPMRVPLVLAHLPEVFTIQARQRSLPLRNCAFPGV